MKQKASEYKCIICNERQADTWHHLILPGRGISRKESDNYAIPLCGDGTPWDTRCHGRAQRNEIHIVTQGIFLLISKGMMSRLAVVLSSHLTVGDITSILRKELGE